MHLIPHVCLSLLFATITTTPMLQPADEQTVQTYFQEIGNFKNHEQWDKIVKEGHKAIAICSQFELCDEEMRIRQQMASAYYCLGDYTMALEMAQKSFDIATNLENNRGKVKSLYLTSFALRGHASQETDAIKKRSLLKAARVYAVNALVHCEGRQKEEELLKAKALYSLGAVELEDPFSGNSNTAQTAFKAAEHIYKKYQMTNDCQRTALCLAKVYLQDGQLDQAQTILHDIQPHIKQQRTKMQGDFLQAQIALAQGNKLNASAIAMRAKELAHKLQAQSDEKKIDGLISHIETTED